jgi:hypothetical protein
VSRFDRVRLSPLVIICRYLSVFSFFPVLLSLDLKHLEHLRRIEVEVDIGIINAQSIPSFVRWLKSSTTGVTSVLIYANQLTGIEALRFDWKCHGRPRLGWKETDHAFQEVAPMMNLEMVKIRATTYGTPHDHAQCIRNDMPYLSSQPFFEVVSD